MYHSDGGCWISGQGRYICVETEVSRNSLLSPQLFCEPKTALKKKKSIKLNNTQNIWTDIS